MGFYDDDKPVGKPQKQTEDGKILTYGALWAHFSEKFVEVPFFSGNIEVKELPEPNEHGVISIMMFPNVNRRKGKDDKTGRPFNDPHYYIVPPRD